MLLSAIYETIFYDFSYGFRKGRGQHQAIHELREKCFEIRASRIISADITGLFDNIGHKAPCRYHQAKGERWELAATSWKMVKCGGDGARRR